VVTVGQKQGHILCSVMGYMCVSSQRTPYSVTTVTTASQKWQRIYVLDVVSFPSADGTVLPFNRGRTGTAAELGFIRFLRSLFEEVMGPS
jgi:hypothetical protein